MKGLLAFLWRAKQKWRYHTAKDLFHKSVAEINLHEGYIKIFGEYFMVAMCGIKFDIKTHGFIVQRFDVFRRLSLEKNWRFEMLNNELLYSTNNLKLRITTAEELSIIHEIFIQNTYLIDVPEDEYIVIDIGMNVGYASMFFARDPSVREVIAFEPFKPTFSNALLNFELNPLMSNKIRPQCIGLGLRDENIEVQYSPDLKGKNSIVNGSGGVKECIEVKKASAVIDALILGYPKDHFYIKMDCEGAEFDIFKSFEGTVFPSQIKGVLVEWHKKYPDEIVRYLRRNSFRIQARGGDEIGIIVAFRS